MGWGIELNVEDYHHVSVYFQIFRCTFTIDILFLFFKLYMLSFVQIVCDKNKSTLDVL